MKEKPESYTLDKALDLIMLAADTRAPRIVFNTWAYIADLAHPVFPSYVEWRVSKFSRL